ncbi:MAG: hypothetical protein KAS51_03045 [Candidatus Omnitrophica bacterium]|nr:hypothetical protein [Candidatus Omnitrophota bacterium]
MKEQRYVTQPVRRNDKRGKVGMTKEKKKVTKGMVKEAINIYSKERLHMSLDYISPEQAHAS